MTIVKVNVAGMRRGDKILVLDEPEKNISLEKINEQAGAIIDLLYNNLPYETWCKLVQNIHEEFNSRGCKNVTTA